MKRVALLFSLLCAPLASLTTPATAAKCTGAADCTACKNCSGCAHCAKKGGSCGVCKGTARPKAKAAAKAAPQALQAPTRPTMHAAPTVRRAPLVPQYAPVDNTPSYIKQQRLNQQLEAADRAAATAAKAPAVAKQLSLRQPITGRVVGVHDGDTITVLKDRTQYKIRLYGVDAPESRQDFGTQAKKFTSDMVFGKDVTVYPQTTDRYGRVVGWVFRGSKSLNTELVSNGFAWWYRDYAKKDAKLGEMEAQARTNKTGLWAHPSPVAPWLWRKVN